MENISTPPAGSDLDPVTITFCDSLADLQFFKLTPGEIRFALTRQAWRKDVLAHNPPGDGITRPVACTGAGCPLCRAQIGQRMEAAIPVVDVSAMSPAVLQFDGEARRDPSNRDKMVMVCKMGTKGGQVKALLDRSQGDVALKVERKITGLYNITAIVLKPQEVPPAALLDLYGIWLTDNADQVTGMVAQQISAAELEALPSVARKLGLLGK